MEGRLADCECSPVRWATRRKHPQCSMAYETVCRCCVVLTAPLRLCWSGGGKSRLIAVRVAPADINSRPL